MDPASAQVMPAVGSQVDTATVARAGRGTAICPGLFAETAVRGHDAGLVIANFQRISVALSDRF